MNLVQIAIYEPVLLELEVEELGLTDYTVQSLGGKKTADHKYCFAVNNDGLYDSISRLDEDKVATKHNKMFEYSDLMTCDSNGREGITAVPFLSLVNDFFREMTAPNGESCI